MIIILMMIMILLILILLLLLLLLLLLHLLLTMILININITMPGAQNFDCRYFVPASTTARPCERYLGTCQDYSKGGAVETGCSALH